MDSVFGLTGKGFTLICADRSAARSILTFKHDEDKITQLDEHKILGCAGENSERVAFADYCKANLALAKLRSSHEVTTGAWASWTRSSLATALRKKPYHVNLLLGGYDADEGATLHWLDYLGSSSKKDFGAHGYCASFVISTMDRYWREGLDEAAAVEIAKKCIHEIHTRFAMSQPRFICKIADAAGVREISLE